MSSRRAGARVRRRTRSCRTRFMPGSCATGSRCTSSRRISTTSWSADGSPMPDFLPFTRPTIDEPTIADVAAVLRSGWIASGPKVAEFERDLAAYLGGGRQVRVMTSATGGLEMALKAVGVGPGHEVIVPAMTFAASANVVVRLGARPVFVDVELRSRNATAAAIAAAITPRSRAVMPVHFAGLAVDMDA